MTAKAIIEITTGRLSGTRFEFTEHDTFLFGRHSKDCHACIPKDPQISRHHFLLEVNPPDATLRDLGSLNGTHVNGVKQGARKVHETPEEGRRTHHPQIALKPGDVIQVGDTSLKFQVEWLLEDEDDLEDRVASEDGYEESGDDDIATLASDRVRPAQTRKWSSPPAEYSIECERCGKEVSSEIAPGRTGRYVCDECRKLISSDPMEHIRSLIRRAGDAESEDTTPTIPGYQIGKKLGMGGMGVVYRAQRLEDGKTVAVKTMLSRVAVNERARRTFLRECDVHGKLHHRNIVRMLESESIGSVFYFIMEYCNGRCFRHQLDQHGGRLPWSQIGPLLVEAIDGVAFAHEQGFVHRDIKPENILIDRVEGGLTAKIADFGLAKCFEKAGFSGMTATGSYAGTYSFMPREQLTNFKHANPVSDIWSLGASCYSALTGHHPRDFDSGTNPVEVILSGKIIPIRERDPNVPPGLAAVIDRSVANDPDERFQSAREFQDALRKTFRT